MIRCLILLVVLVANFLQIDVALAGDGSCIQVSRQCVDGPSTKTISGVPVTRDCWEYAGLYNCKDPDLKSDCQPLVDQGCAQTGVKCIETDDKGACILYEKKYQCKYADGETHTVMDCGTQTYCADGNCFDTSYPPDGDITSVISGMEAMREAGVYLNDVTLKVFNGEAEDCRITLGSLFDCCAKKVQKGVANNDWMPDMFFSVGKEAINYVGSNYMYDILFATDSPSWMYMATGFMVPDPATEFAPSVWGVTMGYSSTLPPADAFASWAAGDGYGFISFDPYSFAAAVAFHIVMQMAQCNQDEQILSIKRGANLCIKVGSWCAHKVLGVCVQKKQSYCCYNSKIARIINAGGRAQLGKGFGDEEDPDCSGFTIAELQSLDLSQMDFSEMAGDIRDKARQVSESFASDRATNKVNNANSNAQPYKSQGYFAP